MTYQYIGFLLLAAALLQGCAGQRESFEKLMDEGERVIRLEQGDRKEVLAIGNGFPGWWGYYPAIVSSDPSIASIDCVASRSAIPFRKPGLIVGGERCYISANALGETWIVQTNKFSNYQQETENLVTDDRRIRIVVSPGSK